MGFRKASLGGPPGSDRTVRGIRAVGRSARAFVFVDQRQTSCRLRSSHLRGPTHSSLIGKLRRSQEYVAIPPALRSARAQTLYVLSVLDRQYIISAALTASTGSPRESGPLAPSQEDTKQPAHAAVMQSNRAVRQEVACRALFLNAGIKPLKAIKAIPSSSASHRSPSTSAGSRACHRR